MRKRLCRMCGREFPANEGEGFYCSSLCRMTGESIGVKGSAPSTGKRERGKRRGGGTSGRPAEALKYPRVMKMFELPDGKRWELAKTFTPEENAFYRKMERRILNEERRIDECLSWDGSGEYGQLERVKAYSCDRIGDSDDGTI